MKNSIKRAQSRAGSSFAERENFRPKVKHLKRKLMMTLALLLTAVTGAWATDYTTLAVGDVIKVGDTFTPTDDGAINDFGVDNGKTYTLIRADVGNDYNVTEKTDGAYYVFKFVSDVYPYLHFGKAFAVTAISDGLEVTNIKTEKGYLFYTLAVHESAASATPVPLTWDATAKTATLTNGMPAGNVTVSVEYYPQATMADGAVTAATDVKATTEDALVTIDENKLTGVAKLMYFVSTKATAPDYDTEGWTDQVPTAANYTEAGNVNVWYYAVGTDEGVGEATATYSDGDICAKALTVTLGAAPLWNAEFDLTDAPEADKAGKWSTNIPEGGVKKGTEVKVTYSGSKKVLGVKAEKKVKAAEKTITIGEQNYTVLDGETWKQFITRNQLSDNWSVKDVTLITWGVFMNEPYSELHVSSDGNTWEQLVFSTQDAPIDTDKQYKWVQEEIGSGGVGGGEPLF